MKVKMLGRPTEERLAIMRNQATDLLWKGKIQTTLARAKSLKSYVEKILTLAINSYEDVVTVQKQTVNAKGEKVAREVMNDGPKKLAARRKIMADARPRLNAVAQRLSYLWALVLLTLCAMSLEAGTYSAFIYFQF